ncbi:hypothetical protein P43SY_011439 [Pythium insidiosum]|uniref:Uncharacterized protein n=1 Tax=Pythium insidiosum TaxID=114742 RepID=A0AAD5LZJ3_PYTIN|nr:hypothetical protein P43SY_011439 [Pythium insidiosum]
MANAYVKQMKEKHAHDLRDFHDKLQREIVEQPPKFSKELVEWPRRQHRLAQQKRYSEAQEIKKEHIKRRNLDSKRLLQRNRSVQTVLESKQATEATKRLQEIKMSLLPRERPPPRGLHNTIPAEARVVRAKPKASLALTIDALRLVF